VLAGQAITALRGGFKPHITVNKIFEQHTAMSESGEGIDWHVDEALAFAAPIVEGNHVRLSG
jgi:2-oxoglutarate dehydrogenase complex dehydrogenase (E1) component-like enzyme